MSYWAYLKEAAFGIFYKSAIDHIMPVILQSMNPFMNQQRGSWGESIAVDIMHSVPFSACTCEVQGEEGESSFSLPHFASA